MLIYIIDDDPDWQNYYRTSLSTHTLKTFSDGVSAMEAIDDQLPDAIILDMLLVGPAGTSLLAELQSYPDTAKIPIVLISGVDIQDDLSSYGVSQVFNKATFEPKELLQWISKLAP